MGSGIKRLADSIEDAREPKRQDTRGSHMYFANNGGKNSIYTHGQNHWRYNKISTGTQDNRDRYCQQLKDALGHELVNMDQVLPREMMEHDYPRSPRNVTSPVLQELVPLVQEAQGDLYRVRELIRQAVNSRVDGHDLKEQAYVTAADIREAYVLLREMKGIKEFREVHNFPEEQAVAAPDRQRTPYVFVPTQQAIEDSNKPADLTSSTAARKDQSRLALRAPGHTPDAELRHLSDAQPFDPNTTLVKRPAVAQGQDTLIPRDWDNATAQGFIPVHGVRRFVSWSATSITHPDGTVYERKSGHTYDMDID